MAKRIAIVEDDPDQRANYKDAITKAMTELSKGETVFIGYNLLQSSYIAKFDTVRVYMYISVAFIQSRFNSSNTSKHQEQEKRFS